MHLIAKAIRISHAKFHCKGSECISVYLFFLYVVLISLLLCFVFNFYCQLYNRAAERNELYSQ